MAAFMAASQQIAGHAAGLLEAGRRFWSALAGRRELGRRGPTLRLRQTSDKRFANEAWRNDPRFDLVKRNYLAYSSFLQSSRRVDAARREDEGQAAL